MVQDRRLWRRLLGEEPRTRFGVQKRSSQIRRERYILRCWMTIKLNKEPNTIKIQASALCFVVIFKR
ncbi:hypothetical protein Hanom_Chr03g00236151 [Helianthus anomalus]